MPFMGVTMRFKSLSGCTIAVLGLLLLGVTSSAAQNRETDRVRVFVQVSEERPEDAVVDANLPPGQWQLEPMSFGTEGNTYCFDLKQAQYLGQQLSKQLQRTNSRKELIELVETREEAAVYLEIVATKVEGNIQGAGVFGGDGTNAAPSTNTTKMVGDALIVRLTMRGQVFTTDFTGQKLDALRTPEVQVAREGERFLEVNAEGIRTLNPPRH